MENFSPLTQVKRNINMFKIAKADPTYEATFTKDLPFRAWEVCELAFDWIHPEKMRRSFFTGGPMDGDVVRKVLERINEHHHICAFRWCKKIGGVLVLRDFVFHNIWQEISQGNYIVQYLSCDFPWQHTTNKKWGSKNVTRAWCSATLRIQSSSDENCSCRYVCSSKPLSFSYCL